MQNFRFRNAFPALYEFVHIGIIKSHNFLRQNNDQSRFSLRRRQEIFSRNDCEDWHFELLISIKARKSGHIGIRAFVLTFFLADNYNTSSGDDEGKCIYNSTCGETS